MKVEKLFEKHADEYIEFDRIPEKDRKSRRPDLCGMLYLDEKLGGKSDAITAAEHDQIWLAWEIKKLTEEDVIYLLRCGINYDSNTDSLYLHV